MYTRLATGHTPELTIPKKEIGIENIFAKQFAKKVAILTQITAI
jgi:hypothetical protein